jgi:hypothetical protein
VDSDDSSETALELEDSALAEQVHRIDEQLEVLRQLRPTLLGHSVRALVMVGVLLVAWYRVAFDGYADALLYFMIGGVGVWCATIVIDVFEHERRRLRLERELDSLLAMPSRRSRRDDHGGR